MRGRGRSRLVLVVSLPEPAYDDERDSGKEHEPTDNDEGKGCTVMCVEVFAVETVVRYAKANDDEEEAQSGEEGRKDL